MTPSIAPTPAQIRGVQQIVDTVQGRRVIDGVPAAEATIENLVLRQYWGALIVEVDNLLVFTVYPDGRVEEGEKLVALPDDGEAS
jgi:hypothetical protein